MTECLGSTRKVKSISRLEMIIPRLEMVIPSLEMEISFLYNKIILPQKDVYKRTIEV